MSYEKIVKLIEVLHYNTKKNKVTWEETERPNSFQASFPNYSVRLIEVNQLAQQPVDYIIEIINENGDTIESVSDEDVRSVANVVPGASEAYENMKETYHIGRRQVLGVEQALDDILGGLEDPDLDIPF